MKKPQKAKKTAKNSQYSQEYEWHKVTPLSKILALILFIVFPIIGFLFGRLYEFMRTI